MIYKGNETGLSDTSKLMLDSYKDKFSHSNYQAHITLGCYDAKFEEFPINFTVNTIVLGQIGNGCTCRYILHKKELIGN